MCHCSEDSSGFWSTSSMPLSFQSGPIAPWHHVFFPPSNRGLKWEDGAVITRGWLQKQIWGYREVRSEGNEWFLRVGEDTTNDQCQTFNVSVFLLLADFSMQKTDFRRGRQHICPDPHPTPHPSGCDWWQRPCFCVSEFSQFLCWWIFRKSFPVNKDGLRRWFMIRTAS